MAKGDTDKERINPVAGKIPVFLVWSGTTSGEIAKVLNHYLPLIIHVLEPWMSEEDAKKGSRWHSEIAGQLEKAKCGILCMTPENLGSEWIHFEAGALSKITGSLVCPFLIGMKATDLRYPLAVFQNTVFTKDDSYRLIETLNKACGGLALDNDRLKESFDTYWQKIESELSKIEKELAKPKKEKRTEKEMPISAELVEELVRNSRELLRQFSRPEEKAESQEHSQTARGVLSTYNYRIAFSPKNNVSAQKLVSNIILTSDIGENILKVVGIDEYLFAFNMLYIHSEPMDVLKAFQGEDIKILSANFGVNF